jgi:hypothetical protein
VGTCGRHKAKGNLHGIHVLQNSGVVACLSEYIRSFCFAQQTWESVRKWGMNPWR